eukprot:TRINITY_DN3179_c0_g1_i2.p1 TRINITY_DN3179_c0_g1~~TRINITY_DN3179_c0_g1_i2.p1  ORF type:complete len:710 (-),score=133.54 TRINITY_DN3179_c0_g1_i2:62-1990(-)
MVQIYDLWQRSSDLRAHYTDDGPVPRYLVLDQLYDPYWMSVYMLNGSLWFIVVMFCLHACCSFLFAIGWRTRMMTFVCWLLQNSLNNRNILVSQGGDMYMKCLLFWGFFLPLGQVWSVDAALSDTPPKRKRGAGDYMVVSAGTVSLLAQIGFMYYTSFLHKSAPEWVPDGSATYLALRNDFLARGPAHVFLLLPMWLLRYMTFAVLYWEGYGPLLFISPWVTAIARTFGAFGFMFMHFGFWCCLRLGIFGPVCMSALISLLPSEFWDTLRAIVRRRSRSEVRIEYDGHCGFCSRLHHLMRTFLLIPKAEYIDGGSLPRNAAPWQKSSWGGYDTPAAGESRYWTVESNGAKAYDFAGLAVLFRASPIAWPLAPLADMINRSSLARTVFSELVHSHDLDKPHHAEMDGDQMVRVASEGADVPVVRTYRQPRTYAADFEPRQAMRVARAFSHASSKGFSTLKWTVRVASEIFCLLMGVCVVGWMFRTTANVNHDFVSLQNPTLLEFVRMFQMDQVWGMFSPRPQTNHWYYVMDGVLANGTHLELWGNGGQFHFEGRPMTDEKPDIFDSIRTNRWMKFHESYNEHPAHQQIRLYYGRWLCRQWNDPARHYGPQRLMSFDVALRNFQQNVDGSRTELPREYLWSHVC